MVALLEAVSDNFFAFLGAAVATKLLTWGLSKSGLRGRHFLIFVIVSSTFVVLDASAVSAGTLRPIDIIFTPVSAFMWFLEGRLRQRHATSAEAAKRPSQ